MPTLQFPAVPPGRLRDFLLRLHQIHARAGAPSTREMAKGLGCSHHKIHQIFTQPRLPPDGALLLDLVEWLGRYGRRPQIRSEEDERTFLDEFDKLYNAAQRYDKLGPLDTLDTGAGAVAVPIENPESKITTPLPPDDSESGAFPGTTEAEKGKGSVEPGGMDDAAHLADLHGQPAGISVIGGDRVAGDKLVAPHRYSIGPVNASDASFGNHNVVNVSELASAETPPEFPSVEKSAAVFVGVGNYRELPSIPSATTGTADLHQILTDRRRPGGFDRSKTFALIDPADSLTVLRTVDDASRSATDTLMLYFAGHGLISRAGELLLATRDSRPDADYTALRYDEIRNLLANSHARRILVVLDCCFSGRALEGLMARASDLTHVTGTYVLTSTSSNSAAFAPPNRRHPAFTESLLGVLTGGTEQHDRLLTLDAIYTAVSRQTAKQGLPHPRYLADGALGEGLALGWNPRFQPSIDASPAAIAKNAQLLRALSEREITVLRLAASGLTTDAIARQLHIRPSTVRAHLSRIRQRFRAARSASRTSGDH
ncbi:caspase, EACC1-associated type [Micromonospora sp. CA-248212]|uniref:caspase, EACC1-associated type n=1 Tax=Micromonospora sp. CA-248212 TaxID=3239961 RepID=UPI003D8BF2F4